MVDLNGQRGVSVISIIVDLVESGGKFHVLLEGYHLNGVADNRGHQVVYVLHGEN